MACGHGEDSGQEGHFLNLYPVRLGTNVISFHVNTDITRITNMARIPNNIIIAGIRISFVFVSTIDFGYVNGILKLLVWFGVL